MGSAAAQARHWVYDWGGANTTLFQALHEHAGSSLAQVAQFLSALGSYRGAPLVAIAMLAIWRLGPPAAAGPARRALPRFVVGVALALAAAFAAKHLFQFPRPDLPPFDRAMHVGADSRYAFPSGHATYIGAFAASLWRAWRSWAVRLGLLAFTLAVCWSRVALGAHFPADIAFGLLLGVGSVIAVNRFGPTTAGSPGSPR